MTRRTAHPTAKGHKLSVGDRVSFTFGFAEVEGVIVEDRGEIGVDGRRLYGVRFSLDPAFEADQTYTELPTERFSLVKRAA